MTACGGGGGSDSGDTEKTIADQTSPVYQASLKAFAETWTGYDLMVGLNDLILFGSQSGNCPNGGTLSYASGVQTMTQCVRKYPADNAYSGTYNGTGVANDFAITNADVRVLDPSASYALQYRFTGSLAGGLTSSTSTTDTTTLKNGSVSFTVGAQTYLLQNLNTTTVTTISTSNSLLTTATNGSTYAYNIIKGGTTYSVSLSQGIQVLGDARPSSGTAVITFAAGTGCSPLKVRFISPTQFGLSCQSDPQKEAVKNWSDADVKSALASAQQ